MSIKACVVAVFELRD